LNYTLKDCWSLVSRASFGISLIKWNSIINLKRSILF